MGQPRDTNHLSSDSHGGEGLLAMLGIQWGHRRPCHDLVGIGGHIKMPQTVCLK